MGKNIVKLSAHDVNEMVNRIVAENNGEKYTPRTEKKSTVVRESRKKPNIIRLSESEMIDFLDKIATRVENSRRRRAIK